MVLRPNFGDVFSAKLRMDENIQGGTRPVVIAQNNDGNKYSPTIEVIPMSAQIRKAAHLPTHVVVRAGGGNGLARDSVVLAEQVVTISKSRLGRRIGTLQRKDLIEIGRARSIQSPFPVA